MHRLLVETALLSEDAPALPAEAARHLRVVRPRPGEEIELFDGRGRWRIYRFEGKPSTSPLRAHSEIFNLNLQPLPPSPSPPPPSPPPSPPPPPLTLFACVTKGSRWDWTVEKATELGVTRIVPVISARTIVRLPKAERAAKRERWLRIAEEAARQSDAKWLPEICEAVDFADSLPLVAETACFVGALTDPPSPPLAKAAADCAAPALATYVGPEGDFTPEELAALVKIATPVSFGPTVLRAETAAIFAVSVLTAMRRGLRFEV